MTLSDICLTFRQQMPVTHRWAYLDHAAVAPLPAPTAEAISHWCRQATYEGDTVWHEWSDRLRQVRQAVARLLGATAAEIAMVSNTTSAISIVAEGLDWRPGDNVVTLDNEFPSNVYPWMNLASRGVHLRRVPTDRGRVDPNRVADACDARTRLVSVSWVGYASGWRLDVGEMAELAHCAGALLMLDAIQGLGVFPLDVQETGVDFVAADGHKWMLGPEGAGLLYVRREHLDALRPSVVGWHSVRHASDYNRIELDLRDDAARFEGGSHNLVGIHGLGASLDLLMSLGLAPRESPLAELVLALSDRAARRLVDCGATLLYDRSPAHRSGIITFEFPGRQPLELRQTCRAAGVAVSCRGGGTRISLHAYNDDRDLDRLIEVLSKE